MRKFLLFPFISFSALSSILAQGPHSQKFILAADSVKADSLRITWKVSHPEMVDSFIVQHQRLNKWMNVASLRPDVSKQVYCEDMKWHFGENLSRIVFYKNGKTCTSKEVNYYNPPADDGNWLVSTNEYDSLRLSFAGNYEIYDKFGNTVKKGTGKRIFIKDLAPDVYYLNVGNKTTEFIKRKKKKR